MKNEHSLPALLYLFLCALSDRSGEIIKVEKDLDANF